MVNHFSRVKDRQLGIPHQLQIMLGQREPEIREVMANNRHRPTLQTIDPDANVNGQIEYRILDDERSLEYDEDGVVEAPYFKIDLPHQGLITVARPLDYETQKMHIIRIVASVISNFLFGILVQNVIFFTYQYSLLTV